MSEHELCFVLGVETYWLVLILDFKVGDKGTHLFANHSCVFVGQELRRSGTLFFLFQARSPLIAHRGWQ